MALYLRMFSIPMNKGIEKKLGMYLLCYINVIMSLDNLLFCTMIEEPILQTQSFSFLRELQINVELQDMHTTNSNVVLLLNEAEKEPMNNQQGTIQDTEISYQTSVDEVRTSNDEQMRKKFWRFSIRDLIL